MPRPKKDNADYFPHVVHMRNDPKVKALRRKFKLPGYAIYNMVIEYVAAKDHFQVEYTPDELELMAGDFDSEATEIDEIIQYAVKVNLFQLTGTTLRCRTLEKMLDPMLSKRKRERDRVSVAETPNTIVIATETTQSKVKESKVKESKVNIHVCNAVADIFGRTFEADPKERMPNTSSWYAQVETESKKLIESYGNIETTIRQIVAYVKHCKENKRKLIGHVWKVSETILSSDWIRLNNPDPPVRGSPYEDAEYNRTQWTDEAWNTFYAKQIASDEGFRKHFQITQ